MNKKKVSLIFVGVIIGALFGTAFGPAIENTPLATTLGALGGLFIGWFMVAANREYETPDNENAQGKKMSKKEIFTIIMIVSIAILVSSTIIFQPEWLFK